MGKREDNLMAKIAAMLEKPVEEVQELKALYTEEEAIYEAQSVLNFFEWRKGLERQPKETDTQWEARQKVWQYKTCDGCDQRFAYSYKYDGVKCCSLDCMVTSLKKRGITFTPGRPLNLRYGYSKPGIVPASALQAVEFAFSHSSDAEQSSHVA